MLRFLGIRTVRYPLHRPSPGHSSICERCVSGGSCDQLEARDLSHRLLSLVAGAATSADFTVLLPPFAGQFVTESSFLNRHPIGTVGKLISIRKHLRFESHLHGGWLYQSRWKNIQSRRNAFRHRRTKKRRRSVGMEIRSSNAARVETGECGASSEYQYAG